MREQFGYFICDLDTASLASNIKRETESPNFECDADLNESFTSVSKPIMMLSPDHDETKPIFDHDYSYATQPLLSPTDSLFVSYSTDDLISLDRSLVKVECNESVEVNRHIECETPSSIPDQVPIAVANEQPFPEFNQHAIYLPTENGEQQITITIKVLNSPTRTTPPESSSLLQPPLTPTKAGSQLIAEYAIDQSDLSKGYMRTFIVQQKVKVKPTPKTGPATKQVSRTSSRPVYDNGLVCPECKKTFGRKGSLTQHIQKKHSGPLPFSCDACGKRFRQQSVLDEHFRVHLMVDKPFKCGECTKQFFYKMDLERHVDFHHGDARYHCIHCRKGFVRRDHLLVHEQSHGRKRKLLESL